MTATKADDDDEDDDGVGGGRAEATAPRMERFSSSAAASASSSLLLLLLLLLLVRCWEGSSCVATELLNAHTTGAGFGFSYALAGILSVDWARQFNGGGVPGNQLNH